MSTAVIDERATDELKRRRAVEILDSDPSKSIREVAREVGMKESTLRGVKEKHEASKLTVQLLSVDRITVDPGIQVRVELNESRVADYAERLDAILARHPLVVFHDGEFHWLSDGFHRLAAARLREFSQVACEVHAGSRRSALRFALGANADHGLHRTNADKRNAVTVALRDEEWRGLSNAEIARMCEVSPPLVADVREELAANQNVLIPALRMTSDGRVVDTTNVGRKPKADPAPSDGTHEPAAGREPGSDDDAGEPETIEVAGDPEPDEATAYLESIPLRAQLTMRCRAIFDRDALRHRKAEAWLRQGKAMGLAATKTGEQQGEWEYLAGRFLSLAWPPAWQKCSACNGGHKAVDGGCKPCFGRGYMVS